MNEKLTSLEENVLDIFQNTNCFVTHFQRNDNERHKLKEKIVARVKKINKKYDPNSHITRNSTPLTKGKISVKESLTPFPGENPITARDITKLEEKPKFYGEGEYDNIEFIRKIYILQEESQVPDEIIVAKLHSVYQNCKEMVSQNEARIWQK
ncbi:hypothetical protein O181_065886 [Austropuccinia psidii MF-1]|uniref:Uncharacterized protein n=1 Tax=Austropuccinia psidii MF-1 TaxID=1389203 RepID=A0A9Q3EPV0_9BASI|nr:hypothetical protein [Austropuccinia psidii MF-1]